MSIISLTFIGFAAVLVCLYFLLPRKCQWGVLLAASMLFYLSSGWKSIVYILVTIETQYFLALMLERQNDRMREEFAENEADGRQKKDIKKKYAKVKKKYVFFSVLINVGLLCFVKYTNFLIENVNVLLREMQAPQLAALNILAPLGISFYTFRSVGYVIDVYRGKVKAEKNIGKLALYVSYFPAIVQGPIDRYADVAAQLYGEHSFDYRRFTFGAQRMLWGYIKKLVIAERAAVIVNEVLGQYATKGYEGLTVFFGIALYSFQIYADFSGGMDIICGLSEIFGISLTENFRRPFMAQSVAEFWQRWHITLGAWMRNYLFYPLSLSPAFNRLGKKCKKLFGDRWGRVIPTSLASFIVFVIVGVWHGAHWKFVVYGIYQAVFVSTGTLFEPLYEKMRAVFRMRADGLWRIFRILRTFFILTIGRYFSIAASTRDALRLLRATFRTFNPWVLLDGSLYTMGLNRKNFWLLLYAIVGLMIIDVMQERGIRIRSWIAERNLIFRWTIYYIALFSLIIFGMYGPGYDAASFIYQLF